MHNSDRILDYIFFGSVIDGSIYLHNNPKYKKSLVNKNNFLYLSESSIISIEKNNKLLKLLLKNSSIIIDISNQELSIKLAKLFVTFDKTIEILIFFKGDLVNYQKLNSYQLSSTKYHLVNHPNYDLVYNIFTIFFFRDLLRYIYSNFWKKKFFLKIYFILHIFSRESFTSLNILLKEIYYFYKFNEIENNLISSIKNKFSYQIAKGKPEGRKYKSVLMIISHLNPGGAERQFVNLAKILNKDGIKVYICLLNDKLQSHTSYITQINGINAEIISNNANYPSEKNHLQITQNLPNYLRKWVTYTYNAISTHKPDVVHSFMDWSNIMTGISGVLLEHPNVNLSFRCTSPNNYGKNKFWFKKYYKLLSNYKSVKFSGNSIQGNNDYMNWLKLKSKKIHYTPNIRDNGIELKERSQSIKTVNSQYPKINLSKSDFVIGGVFRLDEQKCPLLFLKVLARLKQSEKEFKCIIVGDGPLNKECQSWSKSLSIDERVFFVGRQNDMSTYYSIFDILMLTSMQEGTSNVLIEAQSLGIPCVTTNVGANSEIVINNVTGKVTNKRNVSALERACSSIIDDPEKLNSFSQNALKHSKELFSPEKGLSFVKSLYDSTE